MRLALLLLGVTAVRSLQAEQGPTSSGEVFGPDAPWRPAYSPWAHMDAVLDRTPTATIDLDLPPRKRWVKLIRQNRDEILPYFDQWDEILDQHPEISRAEWQQVYESQTPAQYLEELRGVFDALKGNAARPTVTWQSLVLFQIQYELGSPIACSQIVAATPDGNVLHGRNLDYRVISPLFEVTFVRHGEPVFIGATFLGSIGLHTGLKPGYWSFGTNTRKEEGDTAAVALRRAKSGGRVRTSQLRALSVKDISFDELVAELKSSQMIRPDYIVVAGSGPFQGVGITRSPSPAFRYVEELSQAGSWYIAQMNDDNFDTPKDERRLSAQRSMASMTQAHLQPQALLDVMHRKPLLQKSNVVLFLSSPKSGMYCTLLGEKMDIGEGDGTLCASLRKDWNKSLPHAQAFWDS